MSASICSPRRSSKHIKVVQTGQGADEVFAGYHWYPPLVRQTISCATMQASSSTATMMKIAACSAPDLSPTTQAAAFVAVISTSPAPMTRVDKALRLDTTVMLVDDPVKRVDNMTMAWGLEARVPFLDHELVELAARIPPEQKLADGGKGILKDVARRVVPAEVIDRPKGYFPVPALKYIDGPYLDLVRDVLSGDKARTVACFAGTISISFSKRPMSISRRCAAPSSGRWHCSRCGSRTQEL